MTSKRIGKEEKKEQIINAAIEVFSKNGLKKTKIIDIAQQASIGKGTVYEYFSSKDELFEATYQYTLDKILIRLQSVTNENLEPEEKLRKILREFSSSFFDESNVKYIVHYWAEGVVYRNNNLYKQIENSYQEVKKIIGSVLREGIDKGKFKNIDINAYSVLICSTFDGLLLQLIYVPNFSRSTIVDEFEKIYLEQLKL